MSKKLSSLEKLRIAVDEMMRDGLLDPNIQRLYDDDADSQPDENVDTLNAHTGTVGYDVTWAE